MSNKSQLNEYCQKSHIDLPSYAARRSGDSFVCEVIVDGEVYRSVMPSSTKKGAENDAAGAALHSLVQVHPGANSVDQLLSVVENESKQHGQRLRHISGLSSTSSESESVSDITQRQHHSSPPSLSDLQLNSAASQCLEQSSQRVPTPLGRVPNSIPAGRTSPGHSGSASFHSPPSSMPIRPPLVSHIPAPPSYLSPSRVPPIASIQPLPVPPPLHPSPISTPLTRSTYPPPVLPVDPSRQSRQTESLHRGMPAGAIPVKPVVDAKDAPIGRDFLRELEKYCELQNCSPPKYNMVERHKRFTARVTANGKEYGGFNDFESFDAAKENATLMALASIGMERLSIKATASTPPSISAKLQSLTTLPAEKPFSAEKLPVPSKRQAEFVASSPKHLTGQSAPVSSTIPALQTPAFFHNTLATSIKEQFPALSTAPSSVTSSIPVSPIPSGTTESANKSTTVVPQFTQPASKKIMSNYKSALNLYCQKKGIPVPHYIVTYPEDAVGYIATVTVQGKTFLSPPEGNKRAAESLAAARALDSLGVSVEVGHEESQDQIPTKQPGATLVSTPSVPITERNISYKNLLQEYVQKNRADLPRYEIERTDNGFISSVTIKLGQDKAQRFKGTHQATKKAAEQDCAKKACLELKLVA